eukprot:16427923-Heterocapsa_arctica.AAC.1
MTGWDITGLRTGQSSPAGPEGPHRASFIGRHRSRRPRSNTQTLPSGAFGTCSKKSGTADARSRSWKEHREPTQARYGAWWCGTPATSSPIMWRGSGPRSTGTIEQNGRRSSKGQAASRHGSSQLGTRPNRKRATATAAPSKTPGQPMGVA